MNNKCFEPLLEMKLIILIISFLSVYCKPITEDGNLPQPINNHDPPVKITSLPYYGGAQGHYLEIRETADGQISTQIVTKPSSTNTSESRDEIKNYTAVEFPEIPSKYESEYGYNIKNIHRTAVNIINLQEKAKNRGFLTDEEQTAYDRNTRVLNKSAKDLAELQLSEDDDIADDEGLKQWFEKKRNDSRRQQKPKDENKKPSQNKFWETHKKQEEKNKDKETPEKEEQDIGDDDEEEDTIIVNLPPDDASVAEAKPVGLAVAGAGGIAESKPIATAVVGPAGLAIARPVATAIAGVSPDQALVPIYVESFVKPTKRKESSKGNKKQSEAVDFLSRIISKYHQV